MMDLLVIACVVLALVALLALLGWFRAATRVRRNNLARQRLARAGEEQAVGLLTDLGYAIVDQQLTSSWALTIDGQECPVYSRADMLVERKGHRWIAEIKTGTRAPDPTRPATRRQLLEYLLVFDVDGVLLVDMETRRVHEVVFPEWGWSDD